MLFQDENLFKDKLKMKKYKAKKFAISHLKRKKKDITSIKLFKII
jgi:hypothetical protein